MERKTILILTGILAVLAIVTGVLVITRKPSFHGALIDPPAPAPEIKLTDSNDQSFSMSSQHGKVVLIYFEYTNCPDECPLTMAKLKQTFDILGKLSNNVQVLMVTTDSVRDNPAQMKKYVIAIDLKKKNWKFGL